MPAERIVDGLFRVLRGYVNAYVLEDQAGVVLIDCGVPKRADRIASAIRETGHEPEDVQDILITHHHLDHTGSLAALAGRTGATVYVHPGDAAIVRGDAMPPPPNRAKVTGRTIGPLLVRLGPKRADPAKVEEELVDAAELPFAEGLRVIHTPGHTAGQTSFLLHERDGGVLIAGDAAASTITGRVAPPNGPIFGMYTEDLDEAVQSFRKLAALDFEVAVFGHGNPLRTKAAEAFRRAAARLS